jgi:hypothetical protein
MAIVLDGTQTIINNGVPVAFPKDVQGNPAPMLSGIGPSGTARVVSVTDDGALNVNASVTVVSGETEIKNDSGNPIPCQGVTGGVPMPITGLVGITGVVGVTGDIQVDTNALESLVAQGNTYLNDILAGVTYSNSKIDALLLKKGIVGSSDAFFRDDSMVVVPPAPLWVGITFGFTSCNVSFTNDGVTAGAGFIEYSFNGVNVHGRLLAGEAFSHDYQAQSGIYLRGQTGGEAYRIGAY